MLEIINGPADLKQLKQHELPALADEIRAVLIEKLSHTGGTSAQISGALS